MQKLLYLCALFMNLMANTPIIAIKNSLRDTAWMILLQGLNYLVPLFVWPYLMTVLGAEGFGKIGFAMQLMQFMMLMTDFGFNLSATKQIAIAESQDEIDRIATDTLCAKMALLGLSLLMIGALMLLPRYAPYQLAVWVMIPMLIGNVFSFQWLFQGLGKIRMMSVVTSACRLLLLPLTFLFVKRPEDVVWAGIILSSTYVLSGCAMSIWVIKEHLFQFVSSSVSRIWAALKSSFPLFVSTITSSIYAVVFVVILGYFAEPAEVGCYSAVEKIMRVSCYLFLLPALQVFYPTVSHLNQEDPKQAHRLVRTILIGLTLIMVGIGVCLFFGGEYMISLLGKDYAGSERIFHIMAFIPVLIALGGVSGQLGLVALGGELQQRQFRNVYITGAIVAIVAVEIGRAHV